jgi:hypothetical protein
MERFDWWRGRIIEEHNLESGMNNWAKEPENAVDMMSNL